MPIKIEKTENIPENKSLNATQISYTADGGISPTVQSIGVDIYLNSTDLKISAKGDKAVANIQTALKKHGMDAQVTSPSDNTEARVLTVRNTDALQGIITLVIALGNMPGGISHEAADQMIEMEMTSAAKKPSQVGLMSVHTSPARKMFADREKPTPYVTANIDYPLSPVSSLQEDSRPSDKGNERFTHMGIRNTDASTKIFQALATSGIKSEIVGIGEEGITYVNVAASADKLVGVLNGKGLILSSIVAEIKDSVAKALTSVARVGGR